MPMRSDDGFTLVEVLVAFAILAVTLTLAFRSFGDGVRGVNAADRQALAVALAESKLASIGIETPLVEGVLKGTHASGLNWRLTVTPLPRYDEAVQAAGLAVYKVTVEVRRDARPNNEVIAQFSTIRLARRHD